MNRREFLKYSAVSSLAWSTLSARVWGQQTGRTTDSTPNVVVILADDMGYGDLGCQNPELKISTPNLDKLAREGMRFTDAHTASGVCSPTRYSLLTGRYHWRGRLKTGIVMPFGPPAVESDRLTIAGMLREKGYVTGCVGKWHLGFEWPFKEPRRTLKKGQSYQSEDFEWSGRLNGGPVDCGFDYYFGDDTPNFPPYTWIENDHVLKTPSAQFKSDWTPGGEHYECRPGPAVEGWDLTPVLPTITEKAVEWINKQAKTKKPFFLYFALTSPHTPIVPGKEFIGKSKAGLYGDWMVQTDTMIGRVLKALEANGVADNTLLIFTSDNGPEQYAYNRVRQYHHSSMLNLRGLKRDLWEGGHRVPFIVRWPGKVRPGSISREMICSVDIFATAADIVGYRLADNAAEDSFSIAPALFEKTGRKPIREAVVHHSPGGHFAIRQGDWVFIDWSRGNESKVPPWYDQLKRYEETDTPGLLYNVAQDVTEHKNLYKQHSDIVEKLKTLLEKYKREGRSTPHRL